MNRRGFFGGLAALLPLGWFAGKGTEGELNPEYSRLYKGRWMSEKRCAAGGYAKFYASLTQEEKDLLNEDGRASCRSRVEPVIGWIDVAERLPELRFSGPGVGQSRRVLAAYRDGWITVLRLESMKGIRLRDRTVGDEYEIVQRLWGDVKRTDYGWDDPKWVAYSMDVVSPPSYWAELPNCPGVFEGVKGMDT